MKILITGAAGSIGVHLLKELVKKGNFCRCLVKQTTDISSLKELDIEFVYGDICYPKTIDGIADGIDVVFHLAAIGHVSSTSLSAYKKFLKVNVEGTRNLLKECKKSKVKRFVHFSSTAAMGLIEDVVVDEKTPSCPRTPYQKTKFKSEQVVMDFYEKEGMPVVILRPCMVYGEGCKGEYLRIFSYIKNGIFPRIGKGKKLTPLVYIHNIIPAIVNAATMGKAGNVYLLVDTSIEVDVLHEKVSKYLGVKSPYIFIPTFIALLLVKFYELSCKLVGRSPKVALKNVKSTIANRIFNSSKAQRDLQFRKIFTFDESLKRTIKWAKKKKYL